MGFVVGDVLLTATGVVFFAVFVLLGVEWWEFSSYLASLLMVGFGASFSYVGHSGGRIGGGL